ncbi:hypothetical protein BJ508DRAFT_329310 [Ascobolus immersus RN42]|uniref:F-box domain-containing protein n=1 Tax=Ascobolus immersus RN42 TaxID=1160509 RepID=A0A3N4I0Z2_ASCIM|nr:hypothetical protein BJ508DRAFT_329310 [Ascobolus immersus RN42]
MSPRGQSSSSGWRRKSALPATYPPRPKPNTRQSIDWLRDKARNQDGPPAPAQPSPKLAPKLPTPRKCTILQLPVELRLEIFKLLPTAFTLLVLSKTHALFRAEIQDSPGIFTRLPGYQESGRSFTLSNIKLLFLWEVRLLARMSKDSKVRMAGVGLPVACWRCRYIFRRAGECWECWCKGGALV